MDDKDIVSVLRASLTDKLGEERFDLWLGASRLTLDGGTLLVELPSRFAQDWVRSHFRRDIEATATEVLGQAQAIEFRVDESLAPAKTARRVAARNAAQGCEMDLPSGKRIDTAAATAVADLPRDDEADALPTKQTAFDGPVAQIVRFPRQPSGDDPARRRRPFAALEFYIVGQSNKLAHAAAQMAAEQPGRVSPLFLHGPTGVGKTHLLEGACSGAQRRHPRLTAVYLTAEQFTTSFLGALHGGGLPSFRRRFRGLDLLVIDDIQFFAGKRATIGELLVTTEALLRHGSQIVFAADRSLGALRELSEELTGRLAAGMSCHVDRPDYQTRLGILRQLAAKIGFELTDDVAEFIATHLTSHARELAGALNRLDAAGRIWKQPVTRAMAEEALAEMIRHDVRAVRLADIEKAVCDVFGLEDEALQSGRRAKGVAQPRMLAMWLARKHTRAALAEIGQHFGRRSHSTVISAQKAVSGWVASQFKIELTGKPLNVEEAIRRVEERLRTA